MPRKHATPSQVIRARDLARALERNRKAQGLTIPALAERAGLGYETTRALLAGRSVGPSFFLIAQLARAMNLSLDALAADYL